MFSIENLLHLILSQLTRFDQGDTSWALAFLLKQQGLLDSRFDFHLADMGLHIGKLFRFLCYFVAELEYLFIQTIVVVDYGHHVVSDWDLVLVGFKHKWAILLLVLLQESLASLLHHESNRGNMDDVPLDHDKNAAEVLHTDRNLPVLMLL